MKTTIDLADDLAITLKKRTAQEGISLRAAVHEALRLWLKERPARPRTPRIARTIGIVSGQGTFPRGGQPELGRPSRLELRNRISVLPLTVIALDTNLLVYAHRQDSPFHMTALDTLDELANGTAAWAIPWPCLHEFLSIVTHPRIYTPPSPMDTALSFLENWLQSPSLVLLAEGEAHFATLSRLARNGKLLGPRIHDARIAALCLANGVDLLYTADRDFSLFPELKTRNPLARVRP